jgi:hypothetical protein
VGNCNSAAASWKPDKTAALTLAVIHPSTFMHVLVLAGIDPNQKLVDAEPHSS